MKKLDRETKLFLKDIGIILVIIVVILLLCSGESIINFLLKKAYGL